MRMFGAHAKGWKGNQQYGMASRAKEISISWYQDSWIAWIVAYFKDYVCVFVWKY